MTDISNSETTADIAESPTPITPWDKFAGFAIVVVNGIALVSGVVLITDAHFTGRAWLAVVLFTLGPGSGLVQFFRRLDVSIRWLLVVALSVACSILTAEVLLVLHALGPSMNAAVLTAITASGVVARLLHALNRNRGTK